MAKERYKGTTLNSFFSNFLHDQKVPQDHFLKKFDEVADWDRFTGKLPTYHTGKGKKGLLKK
jgi:hypothetical protein